MQRTFVFFLQILFVAPLWSYAQATMPEALPGEVVYKYLNLEPYWDEQKVCNNPHKGWYYHYFDNGLKKYNDKLAPDDHLKDFPGLNDIYLRLAWSYLEPEEGKYNWKLLDDQIERWTSQNYKISFRISCKEYGDVAYATPKWVEAAGAKGKLIKLKNIEAWEPDYGDPVFLNKLLNFHRAFAQRYAGKPWLEYVDIGSYGDWGEGHTAFSERREWPASVIKKHIDIYRKCYKNTTLVISDDIVGSRESMDGSREEIMKYLIDNNITLRDDGVSVKWFADRFGYSTLRNPEFFELFWRRLPINLELEHYDNTIAQGTWKNGAPLEQAVEEAHATYIGFHGYPRQWLSENPELAKRLANRVGYWYFFRSALVQETYTRGKAASITLVPVNRGVAPAYHRYVAAIRFKPIAKGDSYTLVLPDVDNRKWMPASFYNEKHTFLIPQTVAPGTYQLQIGMYEEGTSGKRFLELPFKEDVRNDNFYTIGQVDVK